MSAFGRRAITEPEAHSCARFTTGIYRSARRGADLVHGASFLPALSAGSPRGNCSGPARNTVDGETPAIAIACTAITARRNGCTGMRREQTSTGLLGKTEGAARLTWGEDGCRAARKEAPSVIIDSLPHIAYYLRLSPVSRAHSSNLPGHHHRRGVPTQERRAIRPEPPPAGRCLGRAPLSP